MSEKLMYVTDDRDRPDEDLRSLVIFNGGNGDWYVQVAPKNGMTTEGVRICTSGGASTECPGLGVAIADAYRAMAAAAAVKNGAPRERLVSRSELEDEIRAWRYAYPNHECIRGQIYEKEPE